MGGLILAVAYHVHYTPVLWLVKVMHQSSTHFVAQKNIIPLIIQ